MGTAPRFGTINAAKDYLVEKIVAEAARQAVPLSNAEREMLYWTEDDQVSQHMLQVAEELARECDDNAYEAKIGSLAQSLLTHLTPEEHEMWNDAILKLSEGDRYLAVLIDSGSLPKRPLIPIPKSLGRWLPDFGDMGQRQPGDRLRLILAALIVSIVIFGAMFFFGRR